MKLQPYDIDKVRMIKRHTKNYGILQEFVNSGLDCVEVVNHHYSNVASARGTLQRSAKRYGFNIRFIQEKGRLFMIKPEL